MILIAAALEGELTVFRQALTRKTKSVWPGGVLNAGQLAESSVLLACTGAGKVRAAVSLQHAADTYPLEGIVFTGIAGGLNPGYRRGDLVVAGSCLQYDLDTSPPGGRKTAPQAGELPPGYEVLTPDPVFLEAAASWKPRGCRLHSGRLLTGDQFVGSARERIELRRAFGGDFVDMEGAAAAHTAAVNQIPWIIIKAVSDEADGVLPSRFANLLTRLSVRNLEAVLHLLSVLKPAAD